MLGKATVIIFGIPSLIGGSWVGYIGHYDGCIEYIIGPTQCGSALYIWTVLGIVVFGLTLFLAHLWRD